MSEAFAAARPQLRYRWFVVAGAHAVTFVGFESAHTFRSFAGSLPATFSATDCCAENTEESRDADPATA